MSSEKKPICVVIDTNIWRQESTLLLRTPMGSALLYILRKINGKIGLPEIIEEELSSNIVEEGNKAVEAIKKNFKIIEVIMGFRNNYEVPDETQLKSTISKRLLELDDLLLRIPFTFEHAKSALNRINDKTQPNDKDQQFKDSAIWEAILSILGSYTVHFISNDNGFFENRDRKTNKLAKNLLEDCDKPDRIVEIHNDMKSCIESLQKDVPELDYSNIIQKIDLSINSKLRREMLDEVGFEIVDLASEISSVSAFFTEIQSKLALSFELCYYCKDVQNAEEDERKDAILIVKGDCLYEPNTETIEDIKIDFQRVYWVEPAGEPSQRGVVYAYTARGDNNRVNYTFKEPIEFIRDPKLDREQRVKRVREKEQIFFENYSQEAKAVLEILLDKYIEEGIKALEIPNSIIKHSEFEQYGDVFQIFEIFGGERNLRQATRQLQRLLYPS